MKLKGQYVLLSDIVYNTIKDAIINEKMVAGEKMSETQLANQLDVSRTPVREALRKLSVEGFVRLESNTSFVVTSFDKKDALEVLACRRLLEGEAARLAATAIDEESEKRLRQELDLINKRRSNIGAEFTNDEHPIPEAFSLYDMNFHDTIYDIAGNEKLHNLSALIQNGQVRVYLAKRWMSNKYVSDFVAQHKAILEAILARDPEEAERLAHYHIDYVIKLAEEIE